MAIGTTAAILASSALAAGGSYLASREQDDAINDAERAQRESSDQALNYQRETRDIQLGLAEPFRQFGIQQANAMGEMFGYNPVGQGSENPQRAAMGNPSSGRNAIATNPYSEYVSQNPDLAEEYRAFAGRPGGYAFGPNLPASYDANGNNRIDMEDYGQFHFDRFGQGEGRQLPSIQNPGGQVTQASQNPQGGAQAGGAGDPTQTGINTDAQGRARDRFQGSLFNDALQGALGRAATGVDANFAASGNVYSGAREQAQQNTAADYGMNALGMYTNTMLGQPSTAGAQMGANAAGAFGANAGNIAMGQGRTAANSAFMRGDNTTGLINNFTNLASYGLGAFGGGGGPGAIRVPGGNAPPGQNVPANLFFG